MLLLLMGAWVPFASMMRLEVRLESIESGVISRDLLALLAGDCIIMSALSEGAGVGSSWLAYLWLFDGGESKNMRLLSSMLASSSLADADLSSLGL